MGRSISSGTITFGLVSVHVKFYTSAAAEGVKFNLLSPKGNRIQRKDFDSVTNEEVQFQDCGRGYEVAKDQFIKFTPDELKALEAESSQKVIEITEFVTASSVDPVQIEKSYYLGPDKGAAKAYALLSQTMAATGKVAVAQWNSRGREHLVVIRPYRNGLVLQQMFYANEVRSFDELELTNPEISAVERGMAVKLLQSLEGDVFDPSKYEDGYVARVRRAIDQKLAGGTVTVKKGEPVAAGQILNLETLLAGSLEVAASKKRIAGPKAVKKGSKAKHAEV